MSATMLNSPGRRVTLDALRLLCRSGAGPPADADPRVSTGLASVDGVLGGGLTAGVHEFLGVAAGGAARPDPWTPPLSLAAHLAQSALEVDASGGYVVWIGRACFPYPRSLLVGGQTGLLARSLFVAPETPPERLWAIDLAVRCPAAALVVADGRGLDRIATQRVQLLCLSHGKRGLLLRPDSELGVLSASQSRWLVRAEPSDGEPATYRIAPRWKLELLRCKGVRPDRGPRAWAVELDHDSRHVRLSAPLAGAARAATPAAG